ncbi:hypothetical protein BH20ACI4_BH20ACI4_12120 [soil metagenome]
MFDFTKQKIKEKTTVPALSDFGLFASKKAPFDDVAKTPAGHFDLYFLASAADLMRRLEKIFGTREAVFNEFAFLQNYDEQLAGREPDILPLETADEWWENALLEWEKNCQIRLPLREMRENFSLSFSHLILLLTIGLVEEDGRFGAVFDFLNDSTDEKRPTFGLLNSWQREDGEEMTAQSKIRALQDLGLIQFGNTENPRSEQTLHVSILLWDVLRGEIKFGVNDNFRFIDSSELLPLDELILSDALREQISVLPALIKRGDIQTLIVRGAHHNSRQTILGAIADALGLNLLEIKNAEIKDAERWQTITALAVLLNAMPVFRLDAAPGETVEFPAISNSIKAVGITLGKQGGLGGEATEKSITLTVNLPDENERRTHWLECLNDGEELDEISERFRLSGGNIRRAAGLAASYAALENRKNITLSDIQKAARALNRQALDTLATHLEPLDADWNFLAVRDETMSDLLQLEERCRIRENLKNHVGAGLRGQLQAGVRALFNGTSGTGKTYAARLLASALQKDLYRLDLSTVVNKYIGETEKNLARVFSFVEELDVILLLDEGDALLTRRTDVGSANDRYANLETNYLLQRLESFEGILIVTTNANERIDSAFQRRMDTVVEFAAPDAEERRQIWDLHLPEENKISQTRFEEIIQRCKLTGGQIRNIALHAAALALSEKSILKTAHIESAVRREYRKMSAVCPLRENFDANRKSERW